MYRLLILFFILAYSIACSGQLELLNKYLAIQQQRIHFSGVVMVAKNNQALYQVSIGKASRELDLLMSTDAVFKVASISKQFTAMLVVQAAQERKLRLKDSLAMFFPELKNIAWRKINLHQLLSHTSGIPHNEGITGLLVN